MSELTEKATGLLKALIATPSFSKEEHETAELILDFLKNHDIPADRHINNIWAVNRHFDPEKPTLLLNSHHDTVKPNPGYTKDPFIPVVEDDRLYGLGSNDAGGALVSLLAVFMHFYGKDNLSWNLVFAASAEEEISGDQGIVSILDKIPAPDCAIVGEPTQMRMAVAEKGLMVLECNALGRSGHAARDEGENAIYKALHDIEWFRNYRFEKESATLGPVKMTVTMIEAGNQHNVVPSTCTFTVDVRTTDTYTNEEVLEIIEQHTESEIHPRSIRLNPSFIPADHPLVRCGQELGIDTYGSPTLSDQAFMDVPSLKMGPGKSARSHTADEFICLQEIEEGIATYIKLLSLVIG